MKSKSIQIQTLVVGPLQVNCFIVSCPETKESLVIDPGDEGGRILDTIRSAGRKLTMIVNTHGHFDHVGGNRLLVERTGAELLLHQADRPLLQGAADHAALYGLSAFPSPAPSRFLADGDVLQIGAVTLEVIHIPGHSPGGICLFGQEHLFSGDTLFAGSIGRTDLPGGDHEALIEGIRARLLVLPDTTMVHPGHGPDTTIGREKKINPFVGQG